MLPLNVCALFALTSELDFLVVVKLHYSFASAYNSDTASKSKSSSDSVREGIRERGALSSVWTACAVCVASRVCRLTRSTATATHALVPIGGQDNCVCVCVRGRERERERNREGERAVAGVIA